MENRLLFATGNTAKQKQLQFVAGACGYDAQIVSAYAAFPNLLAYPEDEDAPPDAIARDGARFVFEQIQRPVAVEDTVIHIPYLVKQGLTGCYASNAYLFGRGLDGVLDDMANADCREATIVSAVAYHDGTRIHTWQTTVEGRIAHARCHRPGEPVWVGPTHDPHGGGYNTIFEVSGTGRTLAEHTAEEGLEVGYREPNFRRLLRCWRLASS
jgi:non-canonical purine NTP pyrophosphatase (RdgB/HAM1 family)